MLVVILRSVGQSAVWSWSEGAGNLIKQRLVFLSHVVTVARVRLLTRLPLWLNTSHAAINKSVCHVSTIRKAMDQAMS